MSGKRETTDRARRPPPPTRTARRHRPSRLLPLRRTDRTWTALAPRPPRRPPRLPRPLTRNLQRPRCCREDERRENRPSADLVTGLVRADPAKRRSQRQRRRRRNPRFLSLGAGRYRAVPFLSPIRRWTNRLGIELFPPDSRGPNPVTPIRVVQRGRRHRRPPLTQSELDSGRLVHNRQDHSRFSYSVPPYRRLTPAFGGRSIEKVGRARLTVGRARSMTPANPMDKPIFKRCVWLPYTGSLFLFFWSRLLIPRSRLDRCFIGPQLDGCAIDAEGRRWDTRSTRACGFQTSLPARVSTPRGAAVPDASRRAPS